MSEKEKMKEKERKKRKTKNQELLQKLEEKFKEIKKELGFKSSLEDLDKIFFIKDYILGVKYVSEALSRQICRRISETYYSWVEHLHGLIFPNPGNLLAMTESRAFSDEEKKEISRLISKTMALVSKNSLIGLTKDKKQEAKFIDNAVEFWDKEFKPKLVVMLKKISQKWEG